MTSSFHQSTQEHEFIYLARVVGAWGVVSLHSFGLLQTSHLVQFAPDWWLYKSISYLFIWANPLFIMVSGALLLGQNSNGNLWQWYKRRWSRVGIPTLFWLAVYAVQFHFYRGDSLSVASILHKAVHGPVGHLHFLITILELYLLAPLFQVLAKKLNQKEFFSLTLFFLFLTIILPAPTFTIQYFVPYIGFFMLGFHLFQTASTISVRKSIISLLLCVLFFVLIEYFDHAGSRLSNLIFHAIAEKLSVPAILITTLVFTTLQQQKVLKFAYKIITKTELKALSSASFGIYLIHPLVLYSFKFLLEQTALIHQIHWPISLLLIPIVYFNSYLVVKILQKNRFVHKYILS